MQSAEREFGSGGEKEEWDAGGIEWEFLCCFGNLGFCWEDEFIVLWTWYWVEERGRDFLLNLKKIRVLS